MHRGAHFGRQGTARHRILDECGVAQSEDLADSLISMLD